MPGSQLWTLSSRLDSYSALNVADRKTGTQALLVRSELSWKDSFHRIDRRYCAELTHCYIDLVTMPRIHPRISVLIPLLAGLTLAATVHAQSPAALANDKKETATDTKPKKERSVSAGVASALAASMPKYNPPPKPNPDDENVDLREIDKPRNGIIRLPKYTVQEKKPPVFRERDIYTRGGLEYLARDRYLSGTHRLLNRATLPIFFSTNPESLAMAMYAEDERLDNMADLKESARDISRVDPADGAYIKRVTDETYMRNSGFGYDSRSDVRR